jgi:GAF domain-containing protein
VGRSLAEMAQRDLDAALQLLADRAQFITGATGAAIALRRSGLNDMLCRASTGANAPELGALLSTEFGLSGESVRTKQLLRCDDAERDERVNREVCRHLGIASVVVMPVVHDDEVLGVFELFSGKTNAFGERDLSAMQRLGEMVETAVRLAQLTVALPESLKAHDSSIAASTTAGREEQIEDEILDIAAGDSNLATPVLPGRPVQELTGADGDLLETETETLGFEPPAAVADGAMAGFSAAGSMASFEPSAENTDFSRKPDSGDGKKPLLWSVPESAADLEKPGDGDQSHVPPVLRGLR